METIRRVVLVGLSGVGKSTTARLAAGNLGWTAIDTDAALEAEAGITVPEFFRARGEAEFRRLERETLAGALASDDVVIACGGGAVVADEVWGPDLLGRPGTLVIALDADPATSIRRMIAQQQAEGGAAERPLLAGDDPLGRLQDMKQRRQASYDRAAVTLVVDETPPERVAEEIARLVREPAGRADVDLHTASGISRITVQPGLLGRLGEIARDRWPKARRAWIVTDEHVARFHGDRTREILAAAGLDARLHAVPAGEGSKSVAGVSALWDWMLGGGIERSDIVVALGGGVVGDLAGFAAATVLRGVGLVQAPTTLLAAVDSSVGGKTGINHPAGKNLIGAFYQPPVVLIDPELLQTVPPRELRSGWAEIVKHAIIQRSTPGGERGDLLRFLEKNAGRLQRLEEPALSYLIRRNVALKAAVVAADEREAGIRAYLNFGHTLGHGIEAADYALLHGEAISLGMRAAARIGQSAGTCGAETVAAIDAAIDRFGLPREHPVDRARVLEKMGSDKKKSEGRQRWVLPLGGGGVALRDDVGPDMVIAALDAVSAGSQA